MALPSLRRLAAGLPGSRLRLVGRALPAKVLDGQGPWEPTSDHWIRQRGSGAVLLAASLRVAIAARRARAGIVVGTRVDHRGLLLTHPVEGTIATLHQRTLYERTVETALEALSGEPDTDVAPTPFQVDPAGEAWWEAAGRPEYLLHPWAEGSASKRWPTDRWIALGRSLGSVAVTGGPGPEDTAVAQRAATALGVPCAAGETTLSPASWAGAALRARRVVMPDTGTAHLASAAGASAVVLFGATDPRRYAPEGAHIVRGTSMHAIAVDQVLEAARA